MKFLLVQVYWKYEIFNFKNKRKEYDLNNVTEARAFPNDEDLQELYNKNEEYFNFIKIDLYSVWKNDIVIDDKDLVNIKYINQNALQIINNYIEDELKILSKQTS